MSAKIYNGYRLLTIHLPKVMSFLHNLDREYQPVVRKKVATTLARMSSDLIDRLTLGTFPETIDGDQTALSYTYMKLLERETEITNTQRRDPAADFEFTLYLYPTSRYVLMTLHTEHDEFRACLDCQPHVEKYPYWNNTDRPDDISEKAWDERGKEWEAVLRDGKQGLRREFYKGFPMGETWREEIAARIQPLDQRAEYQADALFRKTFINRRISPDEKGDIGSKVVQLISECARHMKTKQGKAKLKALTARIRKKLIPKLTVEHLRTPLCQIHPTRPASAKRIATPSR